MDMLNDYDLVRALQEVTARTRRIETRLTAYLVTTGHYTAIPPTWVSTPDGGGGYITVPALDSTLGACLQVVPVGYDGEVNVVHNGTIVAVVNV